MPLPKEVQWLGAVTSSAAVLCPVAMRWLDQPLALWVQQHLRSWQAAVGQLIVAADWLQEKLLFGYGIAGWLAWLLLFLMGRLWLHKPEATLILVVLLTRMSSEIAANVLKVLVNRPRPAVFLSEQGISTTGLMADSFSFPSSHTAIYFGLLLPLAAYFPRYRALLLLLPLLVAVERIAENAHYLSDVLAAVALVGVLSIVYLCLALLLDRQWRQQVQQPAADSAVLAQIL